MHRAGILLALLLPAWASAQPRPVVVHVFVALCDNEHQGIVKVPPRIGNGQNPRENLYWGSATGVRTWFGPRRGWRRLPVGQPAPPILERYAARKDAHGRSVVLVADAYDGAHMRTAIRDFLRAVAGGGPEIVAGVHAGGLADVVAFVGHNGLMDAPPLERPLPQHLRAPPETVVLACASRPYFAPLVHAAGSRLLLSTTSLLAPEAYVLEAVLEGKLAGATPARIHEAAARAYAKWQRCGLRAARRLFSAEP